MILIAALALTLAFPAASSADDVLSPAAAALSQQVARFRSSLAQAQDLRMESCFPDTCFYNPDGSLHHWASPVSLRVSGGTDRWGNFKPDYDKVYCFTGGYAALLKRQQDYNDWLQKKFRVNPMRIEVTGQLNIRTLKIPHAMMSAEADELWEAFKTQCRAAAGARKFPVCAEDARTIRYNQAFVAAPPKKGETRRRIPPAGPDDAQVIAIIIETRGSVTFTREYLYPDESSRLLVALLIRAYAALDRAAALVDTIKPYNPGQTVGAANTWEAKAGRDHLEAEQLPHGFMGSLAAAEDEVAKALADARLYVEAR